MLIGQLSRARFLVRKFARLIFFSLAPFVFRRRAHRAAHSTSAGASCTCIVEFSCLVRFTNELSPVELLFHFQALRASAQARWWYRARSRRQQRFPISPLARIYTYIYIHKRARLSCLAFAPFLARSPTRIHAHRNTHVRIDTCTQAHTSCRLTLALSFPSYILCLFLSFLFPPRARALRAFSFFPPFFFIILFTIGLSFPLSFFLPLFILLYFYFRLHNGFVIFSVGNSPLICTKIK